MRDRGERGRRWAALVAGGLVAAVLMGGSAEARRKKPITFYVPDDYPRIQEALEASMDGDAIFVRPGVYYELVDFLGKAVLLKSTDGPDVTVIDGAGVGTVVAFQSGEGADSILSGFTITHGNAESGGGIYIDGSTPTITDCRITDNVATWGGGFHIRWTSSPKVRDSVISGNWATDQGGGLYIVMAHPVITGTRVTGNVAARGGGACVHNYAVPQFNDCTIEGNEAIENGGGLHTCQYGWLYLRRTVVAGNVAGNSGGGVEVAMRGRMRAWNTLIADNSASLGGGASVRDFDSEAQLTNCTVTENGGAGGGLHAEEFTRVIARNSIVHLNAGLPVLDGDVAITYSDVEGGWPGEGNVDIPPLFADPSSEDYRLLTGSPGIDAGTADLAPGEDMDRLPRPLGAGFDMGAFEHVPLPVPDADGDGYDVMEDCDDADPAVHPGATEVKHDGRDQDCTGHDLTIEVWKASYAGEEDSLRVTAASSLGGMAGLELEGYGSMSWSARKDAWEVVVEAAGGDPAWVTVCGVEGCEAAPTQTD